VTVDPIGGFRYLFTFDDVVSEQRVMPGSVTGAPVGGDYRASDYQRGGDLWTVEAKIATPLEELSGDVLDRADFWDAITGVVAPLLLVPPTASVFGWRQRARAMAARLDLVRGVPLFVSFTRHGVFGNTVLTAVTDRRDSKVSAAFGLTFETLRIATSSRVPVPRLPRVAQQQDPTEAADADLDENGNPITDVETIGGAILSFLGVTDESVATIEAAAAASAVTTAARKARHRAHRRPFSTPVVGSSRFQ
jgi:hypothetical protein